MSVSDQPDPDRPNSGADDVTQPAPLTPKLCPQCGARFAAEVVFCPHDGSPLSIPGATQLEGQVIAGRYRVVERLGEGAMGRVYLAEHTRMGRRCAVKVMSPDLMSDTDAISRFNREATNASRIQHPNVAGVYDFGESTDGMVFLAMEFVPGAPLSAICTREGRLPPPRAVDIARQVAEGLDAAHELGIVHRDLKPDNIMIAPGKHGRDVVKIVDFGIAKGLQQSTGEGQPLTRTGVVVGTLQYMSPEQLSGDPVDGRTDLYALGCILYEMLTGESSFGGPNIEARLQRRLVGDPLSPRHVNADVPPWLDELVVKALARSPETRFQSAAAMREALIAGASREPAPRGKLGSRRVWFAAGALAGVATLVTLGMNRAHDEGVEHRAPSPAPPAVVPPPAAAAALPDTSARPAAPPANDARVAAATRTPSRSSDSLAAATTQLDLMNAQRQALVARQAAVDSGAAPARLERGDHLMRSADSAIARHRFATALDAMQRARETWMSAAQAAAASRLSRAPSSVQVPSAPVAIPTPPKPAPQNAGPASSAAGAAPVDPSPAVQEAITAYAAALQSRDIARLRAAYPALTADEAHRWQDIFDATNSLTATLTVVRPVHVDASGTAQVDVAASFNFDYKRGVDGDRHPTLTYHAVLVRDGTQWRLTSIK